MSESGNNNRPDFDIFVNVGSNERPRTERIGAAYRHKNGEGMNLVFFAHPITGRAVAFASKEDEDQKEE